MEPGTEFRMEQSFSERLKRYRKERNLTQQQLADALGVSNKSVSRWESGGGYPDVPLLVPLARALAAIYLLAAGLTLRENKQSSEA